MVHCPHCEADLTEADDVDFLDLDSTNTFLTAAKRFYIVGCGECGAAIGSGVAGAR